ncbi:MAG: hypothetical protein K2M39_00270 [Muribaculaceae bacterium]|nr:hypothetical protein [Muribaculaceae bacterium]
MKKKILSIALIAMSLVSFTGMAQNTNPESSINKEKVENVRGKKGDKKGDKKFDKKSDRKSDKKCERKDGKKNPYAGLTLTEAQQQKLQQLDNNRKAARQQQKMARKENKMRTDSLKKMERLAAKKSYLEEVKAIVGPDQYVVFLENYYINGNGGQGKAIKQGSRVDKKDFAHKNHKGDNRGKDKEQRSRS